MLQRKPTRICGLKLFVLLHGIFLSRSVELESEILDHDSGNQHSSTTTSMDYSCVHANAWLLNSGGVYSTNFAATVDISTSGFISVSIARSGWVVNFNGVPYYDHMFTQSEVNSLNSRPSAATDFVNGQTTAVAGVYYNFGDNIGYTPSYCVNGYWPPGPGCPSANAGTHTFPIFPSPEYKSGGCYAPQHLGYFVNGIPLNSWNDGTSFLHQDVWHNLAVSFEWYDMDVCMGHAGGSGTYHHVSVSPCLMSQLSDNGQGHSPVHGFALDGIPIYGPYQAENVLAESCWMARDYSGSLTGCSGGQRTCLLIDSYNYKLGTVTAAKRGPPLDAHVNTASQNTMIAESGTYYEDMYYNRTCTQQGIQHLDQNNGHSHGSYGYHYHLTMNSAGIPTFPYSAGPKFYGCQVNGGCQSGPYGGRGISVCSTPPTDNPGACTTAQSSPYHYPSSAATQPPTKSCGPTRVPTRKPTKGPTKRPTKKPTKSPTRKPTTAPKKVPSRAPTKPPPTRAPSRMPSASPTKVPTRVPTAVSTGAPVLKPTYGPTYMPSPVPTAVPSVTQTNGPTPVPTAGPSLETTRPSYAPTHGPTSRPTSHPTPRPTGRPSSRPSARPTPRPTSRPSSRPSARPSPRPSAHPTSRPTTRPTAKPTTAEPTMVPTAVPTRVPTTAPSVAATEEPSAAPSTVPTAVPTAVPSAVPTDEPTTLPTASPTALPTAVPSAAPSNAPTVAATTPPPTVKPTTASTIRPTAAAKTLKPVLPTP